MQQSFIELIPRSDVSLKQSMVDLESSDVPFDGYNIPELIRTGQAYLRPEDIFRLRSEGKILLQKKLAVHLRTRERTVQQTIDRLRLASSNNVNIVLLVTGDPMGTESPCTHVHDVIAAGIQSQPMSIAIAADMYQPHWGRWEKKIPAIGRTVDAVFTQPVFRVSALADIHRHTQDLLSTDRVYAGITWITTERSRRYWHEQNHVPLDHLPHGSCDDEIMRNSIAQTADVLRAARLQGFSTYIMLMRHTLAQLQRVMTLSENIQEL